MAGTICRIKLKYIKKFRKKSKGIRNDIPAIKKSV
jgi:hypothetical protein